MDAQETTPADFSLTADEKCFVGVDIGATAAKVAVIDSKGRIRGRAVARSGVDFAAKAEDLLDRALNEAGLGRDRIAGARRDPLGSVGHTFLVWLAERGSDS